MKLVELALRSYYYLNCILGLANVRYDFQSHTFDFNHKPTIIYSLLINFGCFVSIPYLFVQELRCTVVSIYSTLHLIVTAVHVASFYISFIILWRKRKQLYTLTKIFRYIYGKYSTMLYSDDQLWHTLRKEILKYIGVSLPRLVVMYLYSFYNHYCFQDTNLVKVLSGLCLCTFALMQLLLDFNFYFLFLFAEMFYAMLLENIQSTCNDLLLITKSQPVAVHGKVCFQVRSSVWRRHLAVQLHVFAKDKDKLDIYVKMFVNVFASRLILAILCYYLIMTAGLFYVYVKTAKNEQVEEFVLLQVLLDSGTSYFRNLFFFGICERITNSAAQIRKLLTQIMTNAPVCRADEDDGQLQRRAELMLLKLKTQPQSPLTICGFMDLNYSSFFAIQVSLFSSVVILYQSFFFNV